MNNPVSILCVNGSDSTGHSGIQADIKTVRDLGGHAVTAVTSIAVQNEDGIQCVHTLPDDIVVGQVRAVYQDSRPKAVKIGMIDSPKAIRLLRNEIVGCGRIVCSPGVLSSRGGCLMSNDSIKSLCNNILPITTILMLKCTDAEIILGRSISTDEDMVMASRRFVDMGAESVLLRGGKFSEGRIHALLYGDGSQRFFSSVNVSGWQRHGVGGALSSAIATRLAMGDDVELAVGNAHDYLHRQVVYAESFDRRNNLRPNDLYNKFLSQVADNYTKSHDVQFYADALAITTRYLSQITKSISGRTPKQVIDSQILRESEVLLNTTTMSIQEIANVLGFSSQMVFAKFFRKCKGQSPSAYRGG
ncbi:MAG: hydroxymethylpyrimidine/phosphomethylpyrimidine kinase [Salinivirgaceae bacterium]|nr:hydroxymethylpyrimidine/phosphomethylpyrimidine kinase [Salinivirgaceae bacterium]